jgi:hypothetical protein
MADENQNQGFQNQGGPNDNWQRAEPDALDYELDEALAKYAAVEPRAGLEDRVLAHVRAERVGNRSWRWWSAAFAAVAFAMVVIVMATLASRAGRPQTPAIANHAPAAVPASEHTAPQVVSNSGATAAHSQTPRRVTRSASRGVGGEVIAAAAPRLDHFPSPLPLTEQELALARYVSQFPQEATLIAQAQEEYEKEIQQAMKNARPETESKSSDQQER